MSIDIDQLARMASGCEAALRARFDALHSLQGELDGLDGTTCTGREYWRRETGKPDRLYLNHSIDQTCPLHGEPEPGKRLRVYVGSDADRIAEARAAMERERRRRDLERKQSRLRGGLASCGYHLRAFYDRLGYQVSEDGQAHPR